MSTAPVAVARISIERDQWSKDWIAYFAGKSSPIIRPSTGNLRLAPRWTWPTPEQAEAELREFFAPWPVEFTRRSVVVAVAMGATEDAT